MKILHITAPGERPGSKPLADEFPSAEVEQVDIFNLLTLEPGSADLVYCAFALPVVPAGEVPRTIQQMTAVLADRGELWLVTPALEWCAQQILSDNPNPAVHTALFGERDKPYRCGFTLAWLRALIEEAGLIPRKMTQGVYAMQIGEHGTQLPCNIAIGWKVLQ